MIDWSDGLAVMVRLAGLPEPVREYRFHSKRKWRIDLAWPDHKLAVEVEGGVWSRGRHVRPKGFLGDLEKYNTINLMGWSLLRVTPKQVRTGEALTLIELWFKKGAS
jgi:very-short-patch-repair endonuclease